MNNFLKLMTGTALSQVLLILSTPVITRMFSPEEFGISGVFITITNGLMAVIAVCVPFAIVLPRSNVVANRVASLSILCCMSISLFLLILVSFHIFVYQFFQTPFHSYYLLAMVVLCLAAGVQQISERWLQRFSKFSTIASFFFIQTIVGISFRLVTGITYDTYDFLIFSFLLATLLHAAMLYISACKAGLSLKKTLSVDAIYLKTTIFRCRHFIIYRFPQTVSFWLVQGIPVIVLTTFYTTELVGFYTLSAVILAAPANLISKAVGDVIYPQFAKDINNGKKIATKIMKITAVLALVGFVPLLVLLAFGPSLFSFFFGREWLFAGAIAGWLGIAFYFGFINAPVIQAVAVLKLEKEFFFFSIVSSLLKIGALFIPAYNGASVISVIQSYSLVTSALALVLIYYVVTRARV